MPKDPNFFLGTKLNLGENTPLKTLVEKSFQEGTREGPLAPRLIERYLEFLKDFFLSGLPHGAWAQEGGGLREAGPSLISRVSNDFINFATAKQKVSFTAVELYANLINKHNIYNQDYSILKYETSILLKYIQQS